MIQAPWANQSTSTSKVSGADCPGLMHPTAGSRRSNVAARADCGLGSFISGERSDWATDSSKKQKTLVLVSLPKHEAQQKLAEYIEYTGRITKQGNAIKTFADLWNAYCAVRSGQWAKKMKADLQYLIAKHVIPVVGGPLYQRRGRMRTATAALLELCCTISVMGEYVMRGQPSAHSLAAPSLAKPDEGEYGVFLPFTKDGLKFGDKAVHVLATSGPSGALIYLRHRRGGSAHRGFTFPMGASIRIRCRNSLRNWPAEPPKEDFHLVAFVAVWTGRLKINLMSIT